MKVSDFAVTVTKLESKKKQVSIGQVKEILKIINNLTAGALYQQIRKMEGKC